MPKNNKEIIIESTKKEFKDFVHDIIDILKITLMTIITLAVIFMLIVAPIYYGVKYINNGGSLSISCIAFIIYVLALIIVGRFIIMIIRIFSEIKEK